MERVRDILARKGAQVHTIAEDASVFEAIRRMNQLEIGSLVVTRAAAGAVGPAPGGWVPGSDPARDHDAGAALGGAPAAESSLAGIVTERDYLQRVALLGRTSRDTLVGEIMTRRVAFVGPACPVDEALAIMTETRCRHLPVLDDGRLAGLVSIGDCVRQVIAIQQVRIRYLEDYITDAYPGPAGG